MQNWAAIHITAGLLPRGSEDTIVKVCNTAQVLRVVFIINGRVAIVYEYNKSHAANNHSFLNVRYLPSNLGTLVFNYLAYIRPFADFLCIWIGLPYLRCNEFLFQDPRKKPKHLSSEQATAILRREYEVKRQRGDVMGEGQLRGEKYWKEMKEAPSYECMEMVAYSP